MSSETPFRIALVIVIMLTMSVNLYYKRLAASSGEITSHQQEGHLFKVFLLLSSLALWISTLGYLLTPETFTWAMISLPSWVRWVGVGCGLSCSLLMYWTLTSLGKNLTGTAATRENATLVTSGPYRWVRHPYYVTTALLMTSVTVLTANWLIGVSSMIVLFLLVIRIPKEEQMLIERFGDDYRQYMSKTGRLLPRIGG